MNAEEDGRRPVRKRLMACGFGRLGHFDETWVY